MIHEMLNLEDPVYNSIQQLSTEKSIQPKQQTKINPTTTNSGLSTRRWILILNPEWMHSVNSESLQESHEAILRSFLRVDPDFWPQVAGAHSLLRLRDVGGACGTVPFRNLAVNIRKSPGRLVNHVSTFVGWLVYLGVPAKLHDVC